MIAAKRVLLTVWLCALSMNLMPLMAQDPYPDYDEDVFMGWDLEKNIATPVVEKSEKKAVAHYMKSIGESLAKKKYSVELMREGEVIIVSLPTDELFAPNDTLISKRGVDLLTPLLQYMKEPYTFKILYTVNTDDTGSQRYLEQLSDQRNASLYDWFMDQIDLGNMSEDIVLIPYSMGASMPVATNDDRKGRLKNRRVEIFIIPGPQLIDKARHKTLK